jgi:hypothetical protein
MAWRRVGALTPRRALPLASASLLLLLGPIGYLQTSALPPLVLSAGVLLAAAAYLARGRRRLLPEGGPTAL